MLRVLIDQRLYLRFLISVRFFDRIQVVIVQKAVWEAAQTEHLRHLSLIHIFTATATATQTFAPQALAVALKLPTIASMSLSLIHI